jgi:hypothetical protein
MKEWRQKLGQYICKLGSGRMEVSGIWAREDRVSGCILVVQPCSVESLIICYITFALLTSPDFSPIPFHYRMTCRCRHLTPPTNNTYESSTENCPLYIVLHFTHLHQNKYSQY